MMNISPFIPTLNCHGRLIELATPQIMGILNITPDSFFNQSRTFSADSIEERLMKMLNEGVDMLDIGAYSSRPGADDVSVDEEMRRLRLGLSIVRKIAPEMIISVDTFRADVAKMVVEEFGADIINDISGGELDEGMFTTIARLQVPYILMHMQGTPQTMQLAPHYHHLIQDIFTYFSQKIDQLHQMGVHDIIVDPGFGFAKTLEQNYQLMAHLEDFREFKLPLLVGISRKSMIYKVLGSNPTASLNGTTVLHTYALLHGAHILRVHDVRPAKEAVQIVAQIQKGQQTLA